MRTGPPLKSAIVEIAARAMAIVRAAFIFFYFDATCVRFRLPAGKSPNGVPLRPIRILVRKFES